MLLGLGASAAWDLLTQWRYLFYLGVLFLAVISSGWIIRRERHKVQNEHTPSSSTEESEAAMERINIRTPLFDLFSILTDRRVSFQNSGHNIRSQSGSDAGGPCSGASARVPV